MVDPVARNSMSDHSKRLAKVGHILCFQEVHGFWGDVMLTFQGWLPGWHIFASTSINPDGTPNHNSGGVVFAVCPTIASVACFEECYLVPGRAMGLSVWVGQEVLHILNVHNFGLSITEIKLIGEYLNSVANSVKANPSQCFGAALGDLNLKAQNEKSFKIGRHLEGSISCLLYTSDAADE